MYYIGFDIGASFLKDALVQDKKIIKSQFQETPKNIDDLVNLVAKIFEKLREGIGKEEIGGVGIGLAGTLDEKRETMLNSPNMTFLNSQPIKKILEEKLAPFPVKLDHDVHCFLRAEKEVGVAKDLSSTFYLTLGSGIGGAWMVDGKIASGAHGAAGEAGHLIIDLTNGLDFEELASNKFLLKTLGIGSIETEEKARAGDQKVIEGLNQFGRNLGAGLANIINIFDPEAIIISGGIATMADFILPEAQKMIAKYVISPAAKKTKILFSNLGRYGGALGAALLFE